MGGKMVRISCNHKDCTDQPGTDFQQVAKTNIWLKREKCVCKQPIHVCKLEW